MAVFSGPEIPNSSQRLAFDKTNTKSYSGSGSEWKDIVRDISYSDTLSTGCGSESWMGSASSGITISLVFNKISTVVGYAEHPINKWIDTSDASFVMYHFGDAAGGDLNYIRWYANRGGSWATISGSLLGVNGSKYHIVLQYNDSTGGQLWVNGAKVGTRTGSGSRANTTAQMRIYGPVGTSYSVVEHCFAWNRELTDAEIVQNFEAVRSRYGL